MAALVKVQMARGIDDGTYANVDGTIGDDAVRCITAGTDDDTHQEASCPPPLEFSNDEEVSEAPWQKGEARIAAGHGAEHEEHMASDNVPE